MDVGGVGALRSGFILALATGGCSLTTDLSGFSGGDHTETDSNLTSGAPSASVNDGGAVATTAPDASASGTTHCPSDMVYVPAGSYERGATSSDPNASADELPRHTVTLGGFCIDRTEVSVAQYRACVAQGACDEITRTLPTNANCNYTTDPGDNEDMPVTCVTWAQANAFCRWEGDGTVHPDGPRRLPTEAEWEVAATAGTSRRYPWGDSAPSCALANFDRGSPDGYCRPGGSSAVPHAFAVSALSPTGDSPFKVAQMAGNVSEWLADWYSASYYDSACSSGCTAPAGPSSGSTKVIRGGSWINPAVRLRTTSRDSHDPTDSAPEIGMRCGSRVRG